MAQCRKGNFLGSKKGGPLCEKSYMGANDGVAFEPDEDQVLESLISQHGQCWKQLCGTLTQLRLESSELPSTVINAMDTWMLDGLASLYALPVWLMCVMVMHRSPDPNHTVTAVQRPKAA